MTSRARPFRTFTALLIAAAVLIATAAVVLSLHTATAHTAVGAQQMAVPTYFYATSPYWTQLQSGGPSSGGPVGIAVMNPNSGPGWRQNADYLNTVNKTKVARARVFGYVYTRYGDRRLSAVKSDIDKYYKWYNVDGIFLDEAEYRDCTDDSYYQNLYYHVKAKGGQVILNPGTQTRECYADSANVIVNFEDTYDAYARKDSTGAYEYDKIEPAWVQDYSPSLFWHLVHSTPDVAAMKEAVSLGKRRGAYHMYVTTDVLSNPWDTLPSDPYWSEELAALSSPQTYPRVTKVMLKGLGMDAPTLDLIRWSA